mmetsp:Transcript_46661/g.52686  ORF Transcript_46661/g.52686 Transcript_46661/m.52686 type:complete len:672 (+) Transcript_46661:75-2090(+)
MSEFITRVPNELRTYRLGMGYDTEGGERRNAAFHLDKLDKRSHIIRGEGSLRQSVTANASSSDISSNSFFQLAGKAEVTFWGVKASVSASMETEQSVSKTSFEQNVVVQSIIEGEAMEMTGITAMTKPVYNSAFEGFQKYYENVVTAATPSDYFQAYDTFTALYGDSCITRLNLIAGSALKVTVADSTNSTSKSDKYGAEGSVSTFAGGASVASNWGKSMQSQQGNQDLEIDVFHEPRSAVTAKFVMDLRDKYVSEKLDGMKNIEPKFTPGITPEIVRPTIPDPPERVDDKEPPKRGLSDKEIQEETDKKESPEQRKQKRKKRKQMVDKSKAGTIVRDHNAAKKSGKKSTGVSRLSMKKTTSVVTEEEIRLVEEEVSRDSTWDLGGFSPQSFETTKWSTLFPDLKKEFPLTENRIYITWLWLFYLTRLEFLQYLCFLVDVGDELADYWDRRSGGVKADLGNTKSDVTNFSVRCDQLKEDIVVVLKNNSDFSEADYLEKVLLFDERLGEDRDFSSQKVYDTFFDYYDVFHNNPLGFVAISKFGDAPFYKSSRSDSNYWAPIGNKLLPVLLIDASRVYPVINVDGASAMVDYDPRLNRFSVYSDDPIFSYQKDLYNAFAEEAYVKFGKTTYYGVSYRQLLLNGGKMFGVPFLSKLPFDSIVSPLSRSEEEEEA